MNVRTLDSREQEIDRIKCLNIHASTDCSLKSFRCLRIFRRYVTVDITDSDFGSRIENFGAEKTNEIKSKEIPAWIKIRNHGWIVDQGSGIMDGSWIKDQESWIMGGLDFYRTEDILYVQRTAVLHYHYGLYYR